MARRYLGLSIDIHCGGRGSHFPTHENEIAQSECCNGVPFARYWMHNGYINVDNTKMSKSLGNFFSVRDVAEQYGYEPIRYLMVLPIAGCRSTTAWKSSSSAVPRWNACIIAVEPRFCDAECDRQRQADEAAVRESLASHREDFIRAMGDDLNTADAIAAYSSWREKSIPVQRGGCPVEGALRLCPVAIR